MYKAMLLNEIDKIVQNINDDNCIQIIYYY